MRSARQLLGVPAIGWSLLIPFAVAARTAASQGEIPDSQPPTMLEQALIERACSAPQSSRAIEIDAHEECLSARLLSLRTDFGYNLTRLSASERKTLDSTCSRIRAVEGREAYLDCLGAKLVSLQHRRIRANPAAAQESPLVPRPVGAPSADPAPPARQASSRSLALLIGATLGTTLVAAGIVLLAARSRRARRPCRVCGAAAPDVGDLCPACRHQAADALRQAAAERTNREREQQEEQRRQRDYEEEQHQRARHNEEARLRREEEARQRAEDASRREAENIRPAVRPPSRGAESEPLEHVFDPYTILGVPRDTSQENIRAAYQEARLKYDEAAVGHLGDEVREHFRAKAQAVERAYQMLTE